VLRGARSAIAGDETHVVGDEVLIGASWNGSVEPVAGRDVFVFAIKPPDSPWFTRVWPNDVIRTAQGLLTAVIVDRPGTWRWLCTSLVDGKAEQMIREFSVDADPDDALPNIERMLAAAEETLRLWGEGPWNLPGLRSEVNRLCEHRRAYSPVVSAELEALLEELVRHNPAAQSLVELIKAFKKRFGKMRMLTAMEETIRRYPGERIPVARSPSNRDERRSSKRARRSNKSRKRKGRT
jgi:hypothetical protein